MLYSMVSSIKSVAFIYSLLLLVGSLASTVAGLYFYFLESTLFVEWELFYYSTSCLVYVLLFDWMSLMFMGAVSLISSMVLIYSYSYMSADKSVSRFIVLVYLFVVSMVMMVLSPNMMSILLGWDGLGLVSYGLVIYYQNIKSANAGMVTVLSNRIGDVAILLCISWMFNYGGWDFFYLQMMFSSDYLVMILLLVVLAGMTKSAQIPFSAWLPAAMAAPTPVSSLVHSSTLVTAGVYLMIRFNELLGVNKYLLLISVLTLFMSGLGANFEFDLKKIIALSTLSQLGVMMMVLSVGLHELSFFHLISHAMFKSLLFLCAGFYIHSLMDSQDIRLFSKLSSSYPLVSVYFMGCSLSLCGFPFLSGFYSKDLILESFFFTQMNWLIYLLVFLGTMFTITYSVRLMFFMFWKNSSVVQLSAGEHDYYMLFPMTILFSVSLFTGSLFNWMFVPSIILFFPFLVSVSVLGLGGLAAVGVLFLNLNTGLLQLQSSGMKQLMNWSFGQMWFLPYLTPLNPALSLGSGESYQKMMDHGWLEYFGGQGGLLKVMVSSSVVDKWYSLSFKSYLFVLFGLISMVIYGA